MCTIMAISDDYTMRDLLGVLCGACEYVRSLWGIPDVRLALGR